MGNGGYLHFYSSTLRKKENDRLTNRIIQTLESHNNRMPHSALLNRVTRHGQWNAEEFRTAVETLASLNIIRFEKNPDAFFPDVVLSEHKAGKNG